ncbi:MAG: 2-hydroxychromene-2-carboxylate isomerase [Rhodospirillales bacterium]
MNIEFWFEFASTYSYPAAMRVEAATAAAAVGVTWRPFLLGPIFAAQGWGDSPFNLYAAKGRYMWRDMERTCAALGLPWRKPSAFPRSGLVAARIATAADGEDWLPAFVRAVYRANFAEDRDITDRGVLGRILEDLGQPAADVLAGADSAPVKERLRRRTEEAVGLGLFGAPSFIVGDELFWGNDRLDQAIGHATAGGGG